VVVEAGGVVVITAPVVGLTVGEDAVVVTGGVPEQAPKTNREKIISAISIFIFLLLTPAVK
jgi:hypothetical protein